jgi:hypothetical protein
MRLIRTCWRGLRSTRPRWRKSALAHSQGTARFALMELTCRDITAGRVAADLQFWPSPVRFRAAAGHDAVGSRDRARASLRAHSHCEPIGFRNNRPYKRADAPVQCLPVAVVCTSGFQLILLSPFWVLLVELQVRCHHTCKQIRSMSRCHLHANRRRCSRDG